MKPPKINLLLACVFVGLIFPAGVFAMHGIIINESGKNISDKIINLLTPRWHFGGQPPTRNLYIEDAIDGPAAEQLIFRYDGEVILKYNIPRNHIKEETLSTLADTIYLEVLKIDTQKTAELLKRIEAATITNREVK